MKLKNMMNILVMMILLALFMRQCSISITKFFSNKTTFHTTSREEDMVLYPSVSVCKKYTFDTYFDYLFDGKTSNLSEIKKLVRNNSWDIEKVFYFFSHPGMLGLTFPCTTTLDGGDPGKPCMFPFPLPDYDDYEYDDSTEDEKQYKDHHECHVMQTSSPACYTRLREAFITKLSVKLQFRSFPVQKLCFRL